MRSLHVLEPASGKVVAQNPQIDGQMLEVTGIWELNTRRVNLKEIGGGPAAYSPIMNSAKTEPNHDPIFPRAQLIMVAKCAPTFH